MKRVSLAFIPYIDVKYNDQLGPLVKQESMLKVKEFNLHTINKNEYKEIDFSIIDEFWIVKINFDHEFLEIDNAPFVVMEDTSLSKIHFLFTMLNLSQLFVIRKGILVGIITKNDFLKKKKWLPKPKKNLLNSSYLPENDSGQRQVISIQMHETKNPNPMIKIAEPKEE